MECFHLIYYSSAKPDLGQNDLSKILDKARQKNMKNQLTGFLVFRDNYFLQLLEGNEAIVRETLERIKKDIRHRNVTTIGEYYSPDRIFPDWSMALVDSKKITTSAESLIELFNVARDKSLFNSKDSFEVVLRKFKKDAELFTEK